MCLEAYQIASNSVESLYPGKYLADQDDKWTYLEPLIFLTLMLHDFSCKVSILRVLITL